MTWEALRRWGPDAVRVERLTGGMANDVWSVSLGGGRLGVARLGSRSDADLAWEVGLLRHLSSHGLAVPEPLPTLDGCDFVDGLVVMSYVEGSPPSSAADWTRVAATLRQVHELTVGWPQRPGWRSSTELVAASVGTKIDLRSMPAEAVVRCRAAWARLASSSLGAVECCVVHGDPNPRNIRVTAERVGLIDWDEAHVDLPVLDLVLPGNAASLAAEELDVASQASAAWEAAVCWDDDYAKQRLAEVWPVAENHGA